MTIATKKTLAVLCCGAIFSFGAGNADAKLFQHTSEQRSSDIRVFTKWTGVVERQVPHMRKLAVQCDRQSNCKKEHWQDFLSTLKGKSRLEQLKQVNRYMNQTPYIQDIVNWGREDYWETLFEFFTRYGDCEDYAIAKYVSLKKLGFDADDMRIVILNDENLNVIHSVLVVYEGGKRYILDNQIKTVLQDTRIFHYRPIYSINEYAWWRHLP